MIFPTLNEENFYWQQNYQYICGIDEVGRGALAGPVITAAVIFPPHTIIDFPLRDSKTLSRRQRESIFHLIKAKSLAYSFGLSNSKEIDTLGILEATFKAMRQSLSHLKISPEFIFVDGRQKITKISNRKQKAIVKGDQKSFTIAAASVLAKIFRDHLMYELHPQFENYGFLTNVGYGTAKHLSAIQKYGFTEIHRRSFLKKYI